MSNNKAADIYGLSKENLIHLSEEGMSHVLPLVNEMLQFPELYSMIFANLSVANYLYKGKMKPRNMVSSYRKISIGSFLTKICDKIMAPKTKQIAKEATQDTQFGFTPGINYLLCGVLRETLVRKRMNRGEKTYVLAVDVKNAFSTTSREAQMFELRRIGEEEGIWRYSESTYNNTWTVLKAGKRYSSLIKEDKGSKQGGIKSATDYKSYNRPLYDMITVSNLGIKENNVSYGSIMVADDGLSLLGKLEDLRQVSRLYTAFSEQYSVQFCFDKTIINVIGTESDRQELQNSRIKIGGVDPNFDSQSLHIGLMMTDQIQKTEEINVQHRLKKVKEAAFGYLKTILWDNRNKPTIETRLKLYESIIRPVMISGLCALKLPEKEKKEIIDFEKFMLRKLLDLRGRSSMNIIFKLIGHLPIEAHLDSAVLSLLHNIWVNNENPVFNLILETSKSSDGKGTWSREVTRILKKYDMPTIQELFEMRGPEKEAWKKYKMEKIKKYWSDEIERNLRTMSTARFSGPRSTNLDKKLSLNLRAVETQGDKWAIRNMLAIMCDGLETGVQLKHRGKEESDLCKDCGKRDTTEHSLFCVKKDMITSLAEADKSFYEIISIPYIKYTNTEACHEVRELQLLFLVALIHQYLPLSSRQYPTQT